MPLAYRSSSQQGNATGGALTVTRPTGTADGDILIVIAYLENGSNTWSSVGAGFTLVDERVNASSGFAASVWIKRAASEPTSWTWTPTSSGWRTVVVLAYSGGVGLGTILDAANGTTGNGATTASAPGVTTTAANDLLVAAFTNFQGAAWSYSSGAANTERVDYGGVAAYDVIRATAGATGTTTATAGTVDFTAQHVAIFEGQESGGVAYVQTRPRIMPPVRRR
jgi:hypothetical protein